MHSGDVLQEKCGRIAAYQAPGPAAHDIAGN
jgi:hypothetical protein